MFGTIKPYYKNLDKASREHYGYYYCGLCKALGNTSGNIGKLTLSNDLTFMYILLDSVYNVQSKVEYCRCVSRFGTKKKCIYNKEIADYIADVNIILSYEKFLDDINDDNSYRAKIMTKVFDKKYKKAVENNVDLAEKVSIALKEFYILEKSKASIYELAEAFSAVTKYILAEYKVNEVDDVILQSLGVWIGKWIYVFDAWKDYESDVKKQHFNPLIEDKSEKVLSREKVAEIKEYLKECRLHIQEYILCLGLNKNQDIIRNIIYDNFDAHIGMMLRKEDNNDKKREKVERIVKD